MTARVVRRGWAIWCDGNQSFVCRETMFPTRQEARSAGIWWSMPRHVRIVRVEQVMREIPPARRKAHVPPGQSHAFKGRRMPRKLRA